jgi:uncharacterized ferritin-like protein (DUF455 family)
MGWRRQAFGVLTETDAAGKCRRALAVGGDADDPDDDPGLQPPDRPGRPAKPLLAPPREVPKRRLGALEGRIALLHALAHIELNAVDLAFDMALRFEGAVAAAGLDARAFVADWIGVGRDEARHFLMLEERLSALGSFYGALPAHDGLWEAAHATADSVLARLAIAPMVLEARGLDVTPNMAERLERAGDADSAAILRTIHAEEIGHVGRGVVWFEALCREKAFAPADVFARLVRTRFRGRLKPPFNEPARMAAGLGPHYHQHWSKLCEA